MSNIREQFKARAQEGPKYESIDVEGIGAVQIKKLNAGEKDAFEAQLAAKNGNRAAAVIHGCFDERGARIFEEEDKLFIETLDPDIVDPIVQLFMRLNGYSSVEQERIAKNLNGQVVNS